MKILLVKEVMKSVIPKIIGLAGYKDSNKTSTLSAVFDGSKFTAFIIVISALVISLLPADVSTALVELISLFAGG